MRVKITRFTTILENDKSFNNQQRSFFKAPMKYDSSYLYRCRDGGRIYLFAFDQADLIQIGILGILYNLPKTTKDHDESL
ncbi:hypothetical protein KA005_63315 [bacterium]|nr:hypothetical protein [bacterium]